jgi:hypothetical protein
VRAVQSLGIDVRCGLHTGELERIDGRRLGGIAAHIGARVMAQAGPAEVLVTATVRDLVVGGGISFTLAHDTELRGIPGRWTLHRVTELDGVAAPPPLEVDEAGGRRGAARQTSSRRPPVLRPAVVGVALVGALAIAGLGAVVLTLPRDDPSLAGAPSPSSGRPPSMLKIDAETNEIADEVYDKYLPVARDGLAVIVDGTLWQETPINVVRRDLETGAALDVIEKPENTLATWFAFGSVWFEAERASFLARIDLHRLDPLSGRELAVIEVGPSVRDIAFGRDAIYLLTPQAELLEIDPDQNDVIDRDQLPIETVPDAIVSVRGAAWICECEDGRITHWDPGRDALIRTVEFAQRGFVLGDRRELSQGNVSVDQDTVWLMDGDAGTITPVDTRTGEAGQPIGIPQDSFRHDFAAGSIWISARTEVYRLDLETKRGERIPLPDNVYAGGIAVDEATGTVWLANFVP